MPADQALSKYWSHPAEELLRTLGSSTRGLAPEEAQRRRARHGRNVLTPARRHAVLRLLLDRFRSPLLLILIFAALVSLAVHDWVDALVVLGIVLISAVLGAIQEYRATSAVEKLRQRVAATTTVLRDDTSLVIASADIVPGDIVLLSSGSLVPADGVVLEAKDFFVSQALLTGETFPVEKRPGVVAARASLAERDNSVFMGTSARSGTAKVLIVHTGRDSAFGEIAESMAKRPPETEFERGLRHFGGMLMKIMVLVVLAVLTINILLQRPTVDTLLFAIALAVGLSPELLPAILAITLSKGAQKMAAHGVIVRQLNAIENLGSMGVLCTDKTGTLTQGVVNLDATLDAGGQPSAEILRLAALNARLQQGLSNPLDGAVVARAEAEGIVTEATLKLDEIPYDFVRKRLSIVVAQPDSGDALMITKGALEQVLEACDQVQRGDATVPLDASALEEIRRSFTAWSEQGYRVLGVARRSMERRSAYTREDERNMSFAGFLLFFDPPEPGVRQTLDALHALGVRLKIITGDNRLVARHVAGAVGLPVERILTGAEMLDMKDEALWRLAPEVSLFAEVDPNQKERIIRALQKTGHVVGYLGDGINDAPALHAADVGISVNTAVDVAKEAADLVLLEHDLDVVRQGIDEGRHTFANTLKYIFVGTSANFGNMISMAAASLFLPFLPMLAKQVLLNNFMADIPAMSIAGDNVDREWESTPHRWDMRFVRNFMITFGLVSTIFDMITFGALFYLVGETPELFRTGWFVESLLTQLAILFVIRTYLPFYASRPGSVLAATALVMMAFAVLLPYSPLAAPLGFVPLPLPVLSAILAISILYIVVSELTKQMFYRRIGAPPR